jgi:hypothetical protein
LRFGSAITRCLGRLGRAAPRGGIALGRAVVGGVAVGSLTVGMIVLSSVVFGSAAGRSVARADTAVAPLAGSSSGTLTQVNVTDWSTDIYLDTAALCLAKNVGTNTFSLVTGTPDTVTSESAATYPDGLRCDAQDTHPVTRVTLTFTPSPPLSAVPQTATLTVTPPQALLTGGDAPSQIPLTVRRDVSPWQYVGIPFLFGVGLAALLVLLTLIIGLPRTEEARQGGKTGRVRWGREFWVTPLYAGGAWSFGDSWATSVTPLTGLVGGVLAASGAVAGLVPGVELGRFALLMALVGGITVLAPLLFGALNSLFPDKDTPPAGEVVAARLWVMLLPSCLTVFAVGAEMGIVGWVLGHDLIVTSPLIRWCAPVVAALSAVLFLAYGAHAIVTLVGQPSGAPKATARRATFMP